MEVNQQVLLFILISLIIIVLLLPIIAFIFEIAFITRLLIPIIYIILMYTAFSGWRQVNEQLYAIGLVSVMLISILSWLPELFKMIKERETTNSGEVYRTWQLNRAKERGIDLNNSMFDKNDNLIDKDTGKKLVELDE